MWSAICTKLLNCTITKSLKCYAYYLGHTMLHKVPFKSCLVCLSLWCASGFVLTWLHWALVSWCGAFTLGPGAWLLCEGWVWRRPTRAAQWSCPPSEGWLGNMDLVQIWAETPVLLEEAVLLSSVKFVSGSPPLLLPTTIFLSPYHVRLLLTALGCGLIKKKAVFLFCIHWNSDW